MKSKVTKHAPAFQPVTIELTLENKQELDAYVSGLVHARRLSTSMTRDNMFASLINDIVAKDK